ncbi:MAG: hypothetical protein EOM35_08880 [Negativicutes bacterium]|nr:hypothetical protein [Negativicutes bacterium]
MTQLIASNQLTLTNIIDGKTPYVHWAYSDNADGTGLTTSDNGQRYIGQYTDYTQTDSTDKTKYRWSDRWARLKLEDNLLLNSSFNQNLDKWQNYGATIVEGKAKIIGEFNKTKAIYQSIQSQLANDDVTQVYIASFSVKVTNYIAGSVNPFLALYIDGVKNDSNNTWYGATSLTPGHFHVVNNKGVVQFSTTFRIAVPRNQMKSLKFFIYARDFTGEVEFEKASLRRGNIDLGWQASPEDVKNQIDSKADQALTEQQLNLLTEKAQQIQVELEAKVAMETLSDLERAYKAYVEANDKAVAKSQADLIEAGRRVDAMVETLGGLSKTKTFIETYIKEADEGIIIGTKDNVSQIRITYDRIAMYSAGKEVMYISQGVIHIDNGVFTKSLQIGRFRTEQHQTNLDINVCRYVG